ncbi:MAG: glycosyl hydrolase, partial [Pedobacter sp.]
MNKKTAFILALVIACFVSQTTYSQTKKYPFQDYKLSFEVRVKDLVSRLTVEEKVAQMLNAAPAIPRLGVPAHDWWNEVLHGVARSPYKTTVFPQA